MGHCEKEKRKRNPIEEANIFSKVTFGYTLGLFRKGLKTEIEEGDLYEILKSCRSKKCGDKTEQQWRKSKSIVQFLWNCFGIKYVFICALDIAWTIITSVLQPYGLSRLISYFQENQKTITKNEAYMCATIVVILKVLHFMFWQNLQVYQMIFGMEIRTSLKSLLYRKSLKLSPSSLSGTNIGNLVTIITRDINEIQYNLWMVKDFLVFSVQTFTVAYLLWAKMGHCAFIVLGLMFLVVPIQAYLGSKLTKLRLKVGKNCDKRVKFTQEVLSAIKIIKMYTWESFFINRIAEYRNMEIITLMKVYFLSIALTLIGITTGRASFLILIIWLGFTTNTEMMFYMMTLFYPLTMSLSIMIPQNMTKAATFHAAFIRLNRVLQADELRKVDNGLKEKPSIQIKEAAVKIGDKEVLKGVSLHITKPGLVAVSGPVGSGKSSLLNVVSQDFPIYRGQVKIRGSISFASQEPWLFPATIKQNILFGETFDSKRYKEVIKLCALEYDLSFLENGEETFVVNGGQNLSKGQQSRINLARAIYRNSDIYLLDDCLNALDNRVQNYIFTECIQHFLKSKICILVSQNLKHIAAANHVIDFCDGSCEFNDQTKIRNENKFVELITLNNEENEEKNTQFINDNEKTAFKAEQQQRKPNIYHEVKKSGKVDLSMYMKHIRFGGGFLVFGLVVMFYVLSQVCDSMSDKLWTQWIDLQQEVLDMKSNSTINSTYFEEVSIQKDYTFNMSAVLIVLRTVFVLITFYAFTRFCRSVSINLHQTMSSAVLKAAMSFFDTHYIGNILNRFSCDINNIDEKLNFIYRTIIEISFAFIGNVILIATVNWFFLIPSSIYIIILILMRICYIQTGRCLKRLETATTSPMLGHINASLEGLTTIRAFKAENALIDEFDRHQDFYSSAYFTLQLCTISFAFFLDVFSTIFSFIIIARFLFFEHDTSAGDVGLALTQVFLLTSNVQTGISQWANLESCMTSVERSVEYTEIDKEPSKGKLAKHWPSEGALTVEKVTLYYNSSKVPILNNLNFSVKPREKIGIVGRTGAGKSSLISVLFRLYEFQGKIEIDGVDIKTLSLNFLRRNIALIPQDPVLFTGTIRDNIDPYRQYTDENIWMVIEKVKMKNIISTLDTLVQEKNASFSVGQKQLFCLARAALRKCKIVVLDEATSNVDDATDKMIQSVIDELFLDCTVLTVAHRLHSIINCDKVIVMDNGELVEYDNPRVLMNNESSLFHKMCEKGKTE